MKTPAVAVGLISKTTVLQNTAFNHIHIKGLRESKSAIFNVWVLFFCVPKKLNNLIKNINSVGSIYNIFTLLIQYEIIL